MAGCLACAQGFEKECQNERSDDSPCCCGGSLHPGYVELVGYIKNQSSSVHGGSDSKPLGRPEKSDEEVEDPRSTMRRRAQKVLKQVYGLERNVSHCQWRNLLNCGGGRNPIEGCSDGLYTHAHHGPDKDWYKNTPTNLHGICAQCHNRWHAANDKDYDPNIAHSPIKRTDGTESSGNT